MLAERYGIPAAVQAYSGSRDLIKFYEMVKRKDPYTKAVIGFSNFGIDKDYSVALVYVEYYRPGKMLIKFYYQMELEKPNDKLNTGDVSVDTSNLSGVKSYKMIQIAENN